MSERENNGTFRPYNFPVDFTNLIGFWVALSQIVDEELDF